VQPPWQRGVSSQNKVPYYIKYKPLLFINLYFLFLFLNCSLLVKVMPVSWPRGNIQKWSTCTTRSQVSTTFVSVPIEQRWNCALCKKDFGVS